MKFTVMRFSSVRFNIMMLTVMRFGSVGFTVMRLSFSEVYCDEV